MATVRFTSNLARHISCDSQCVDGNSVAEALRHVFNTYPKLESYVLDDQGALRRHMLIFINGQAVRDRQTLSDAVPDAGEVYVMQALSGG